MEDAKPNSLLLVCISDLHGDFPRADELPDGDVLVIAGDATARGTFSDFREMSKYAVEWTDKFKHVVYTPGNHDALVEQNKYIVRELFEENCKNFYLLINDEVTIDGIKFWASPVTPPFMNWHFMWESARRKRLYDSIPTDVDVIVTHGPPKGTLDEVYAYRNTKNLGCPELAVAINRIKPQIHVFGHIHEGYGEIEKNGVHFINASAMNGAYDNVNAPITVRVFAKN